MVGLLNSRWKGRSAAEKELSVLDGCVLNTLGCKSGCSTTGRERVIQELHEIHVPTRHYKNEKLSKKPCVWASLNADLEANV